MKKQILDNCAVYMERMECNSEGYKWVGPVPFYEMLRLFRSPDVKVYGAVCESWTCAGLLRYKPEVGCFVFDNFEDERTYDYHADSCDLVSGDWYVLCKGIRDKKVEIRGNTVPLMVVMEDAPIAIEPLLFPEGNYGTIYRYDKKSEPTEIE